MYKSVIGLEIHAQLLTKTKLFCSCSTEYGDSPNTNVCPVCLGYPGALPVLNREAVRKAVRAAIALNCEIAEVSFFDRKNYFYPDLPKGYQITQFYKPFATNGYLTIEINGKKRKIGIERIHIEEDAGKSIHDNNTGKTYIDFNRTGIPLIEIVTKPDIESAEEASEFLKRLRQILIYIGVNDGNLEEGSLRCDANVSIHKPGTPLGTRVEIKNVNSFKFIQKAINYEIKNQKEIINSGEKIEYETKLFDSKQNKTFTMRTKEEMLDYRYFPEPDLLALEIDKKMVEEIKAELPELPSRRIERFIKEYKLNEKDAASLTVSKHLADFFEDVSTYNKIPIKNSNWILSELLRYIKDIDTGFINPPVNAEMFAAFVKKVNDGEITGLVAKELLPEMIKTGKDIDVLIKQKGVEKIDSDDKIKELISDVLFENQKEVERYKSGEKKLFGFFVGQVMKKTKGRANPQKVNLLLKEILNGK
jgi:aspartyl-tRNA(Asn)/glutamyl-tRNA(Gln) amidotransferase subunit B